MAPVRLKMLFMTFFSSDAFKLYLEPFGGMMPPAFRQNQRKKTAICGQALTNRILLL
jgi:hypothetical protein